MRTFQALALVLFLVACAEDAEPPGTPQEASELDPARPEDGPSPPELRPPPRPPIDAGRERREVDVLSDRLLDAELRSPLVDPAELGVVRRRLDDSGAVLPVDGRAYRVIDLSEAAPIDAAAGPDELQLRDGTGVVEAALLIQRSEQVLDLAQHPSFAGMETRRDVLGKPQVLVTRDGVVELPLMQLGVPTKLSLLLGLGPGGGRSEQRPQPPPTVAVSGPEGELGRLEVLDPSARRLELSLPAALGPTPLRLSFSHVVAGSGDTTLVLKALEIRHEGADRVLVPAEVAAKDLVLAYPPRPPAKAARLELRRGRVAERVLLAPGRVDVFLTHSQRFELHFRGELVARTQNVPARQLSFEVEQTEVGRLEVLSEEGELEGEAWLIQSAALYLKELEATRGEEEPGGHPVVRHLDIDGEVRRALLVPAESELEIPVQVHRGDVLRCAIGARSLRDRESPRGRVQIRLVLLEPSGAETVLFEDVLRGPQAWEDHEIPLPSVAIGPGTLVWRTTRDPDTAATGDQILVAWSEPMILPRERPRRPNVLVYLIDTLRADHLSCYGYARKTSPRLDRLAREGILFERAYAQAPWTRPSVATLFTGWYGGFHGSAYSTGLDERLTTIAEAMRRDGYLTAAFIANAHVHGASLNFEQGFGKYVGVERQRGESRASDVNDFVLPWLDRYHDQPFFLYVHTIDPHATYDPPPETAGRFNKGYEGLLAPHVTHAVNLASMRGLEERDIQYLRDLYDEEILFNDREFGRLLKRLRDLGVYDDTIVVVVSDHGEEFFEHGGFGHEERLWDELIHVPLIVKLAGAGVPQGVRVQDPVGLIDVFPTLMALTGVPADPGRVMGEDLAPWWRGEKRGPRPLLAEETQGPMRALIYGDQKLIEWSFDDPAERRLALFDLAADPGEQQDRHAADPEAAAAMVERLQGTLAELESRFERLEGRREGAMSEAQRAALAALGYLGEGDG